MSSSNNKSDDEGVVIHLCPPDGSGIMPCCGKCRIAMGDFLPVDGRVVSVMETNVEVLISEVRNAFDVTRLLGAGFVFATREDYDLAKEWAERAYQAGREYQEAVHDSSHKAGKEEK